MIRRRLLQVTGAIAATGLAFVGLVGVAHTELGRPLLQYLPGMGSSCPVGADLAPTPEALDAARADVLERVRGTSPARSLDAFGFRLSSTTRADVLAWAGAHAVACTSDRHSGLRCTDVPPRALPIARPVDEIEFSFAADDRLVSASVSTLASSPAAAADLVTRRADAIGRRLGAPTSRRGEPTAAFLERGAMTQVAYEYRRADLRARLVATNLGVRGIGVREIVQGLGDAD